MKNLTTETLRAKLAELEYYRDAEIRTTGYVCGKTFKELSAVQRELGDRGKWGFTVLNTKTEPINPAPKILHTYNKKKSEPTTEYPVMGSFDENGDLI